MWSFWDEIVNGITTPDLSCERERSCNEKLARTRGKVGGGRSGVDRGLFTSFCAWFRSIDNVEGERVGALGGPEVFRRKSFRTVERLMYNNTSSITRMRHHCIVPPIPPRMPWSMLPMPVVESLTACPVDCMTLEASSPGLPTTFSSRSPTPFRVSWIAPPMALMIELPP